MLQPLPLGLIGNRRQLLYVGNLAHAIVALDEDGWKQVTTELAFERSGPERYLSSFRLIIELIREVTVGKTLLTVDPNDTAIVVAIINMARSLDLEGAT